MEFWFSEFHTPDVPKESKFLGDRPTLCQKVVVEQLHEAHCAFYNKAVCADGRREWDSNPRYVAVRQFSRLLP